MIMSTLFLALPCIPTAHSILVLAGLQNNAKLNLPVKLMNNETSWLWHKYISKFVAVCLMKGKYIGLLFSLSEQQRQVFVLMKHTNKFVQLNRTSSTIAQIAGKLSLKISLKLFTCSKYTLKLSCFYVFQFYLHDTLALNLSIVDLFFSSHPSDCFGGNLTIYPKSNQSVTRFYFCGQHSQFQVFPIFSKLRIILMTNRRYFYYFESMFSVFEKFYRTTFQHYEPGMIYPAHIVFHTKFVSTISYYLLSNKTKYIKITDLGQDNHLEKVYDGPGKLSPQLVPTNGIIICKSFQCIFEISVPQHPREKSVKYCAISQQVAEGIFVDNSTELHLSPGHCSKTFCVTIISTTPSFYVNATITEMVYVGKTLRYNEDDFGSISCRYAGLFTVSSNLQEEEKEILSMCKNHSLHSHLSKSFYSTGNSFMLFMYWYHEYSYINATVLVVMTRCNQVEINVCDLQDIGRHVFEEAVKQNQTNLLTKWQTYLKYIKTFNGSIQFVKNRRRPYYQDYSIMFNREGCFVFQLYKEVFIYKPYSPCFSCLCSVRLLFDWNKLSYQTVLFQSYGSMNEFSTNLQLTQKKLGQRIPRNQVRSFDTIQFRNTHMFMDKMFCYLYSLVPDCYYENPASLYNSLYRYYQINHQVSNLYNSHFFQAISDPNYSRIISTFEAMIQLIPHMTSWFDFVVTFYAKPGQEDLHQWQPDLPLGFSTLEHNVTNNCPLDLWEKSPFETHSNKLANLYLLSEEIVTGLRLVALQNRSFLQQLGLDVLTQPLTNEHRLQLPWFWCSTMPAEKLTTTFFISFFQPFRSLTITLLPKSKNKTQVLLKTSILSNNYLQFEHFKITHLKKLSSSQWTDEEFTRKKEVYFTEQNGNVTTYLLVYFDYGTAKLNWLQAAKICKYYNASLVSLNSRNQLEELVAAFKLSHTFRENTNTELFIGLNLVRRTGIVYPQFTVLKV